MSIEETRSVKVNMVLNGIRGILTVLFPLITFPYISRVLNVSNIGRYNYSASVISYFILLSGLGIEKYAIREGAALREDKTALNRFANEMFTINMLSTALSYLLLLAVVILFPGLKPYWILMIILSFQIILRTVAIDWIYSIYEDYLYITLRGIAFQVLSLVMMFCFVHTEEDLNKYALITVFANAGSSILNYLHARKYIKLKLVRKIDWKKHMRPIMIMFAMSLTVTIYVSSDVTVLGILCGDKTVGIYSVSTKIYTVVKGLLSTVLVVSIPRLSAQIGTGRIAEFRETAKDIYCTLLSAMLPAITGIIVLSKPIVLFVSGPEYVEASSSLAILGVALFMCMAAWFWGQCVLVPMKEENEVFKVTLFSAVLNLVLNLLLIPRWKENAAAFTTLLAEGCTFLWSMIKGKKLSGISGIVNTYIKALVGCASIVFVCGVMKHFISDVSVYVISAVILSIAVYVVIELLLKNDAVYGLFTGVRKKLRRNRG